MSRILITGGAGFIGAHLAKVCVAAGHEVHVVLRPGSDDERLRPLGDDIVRHGFDLQSEAALKHCLSEVQPDRIFHLAARPRRRESPDFADAAEGVREHLQTLVSLLGAAATTRRPPAVFIRSGSLAEYGLAPAPYHETSRETPVTTYGAELAAATHLIGGLQTRLPFPVITARLALVYGPSQATDYLMPSLIRRCLTGEPSIVRHPRDRRDLLYIDDVVDALLRLGESRLPGPTIVNIASTIAPTMREVAQMVVEQTGADPRLIEYGADDQSSGIVDLRGSADKAHELIGWRAHIPLVEGVARTVAWYRKHTCAGGSPRKAGYLDGACENRTGVRQ
ncbi:NAD-dependent epimerase/dehydratase family protein [Sinorhizobium mexicanum]|uniref:NAD(P)-dependent oxidoreductase n=1 Tax=Sinorhizobium mexicanum TaxID=375549 RepID=A0A859QTH8_9HYPH|nr:NAD(P)-dependent oxidoreductase [Sinorhizobium mexicanum]MBP1886768.1 nucleoside-diphosphate-sugar epimerase [Sinorhizobium mexicanum]QLL65980.1 NAD(P)-dependent oxidoreductase [Sinorhizobium mexicanum]